MASEPLPSELKPINSFLKLAKEYDKRDPTIAYFCRLYAVQKGIKVASKASASKVYLLSLMDEIEKEKKALLARGDEAVGNDIVAQAHVENVSINLFTWADGEDRKGVFNKSVTKAFYSASLLFDVLSQFEEISDQCKVQQKYAKWKATYLHKCMQSGETPVAGPEGSGFEDDLNVNMPGDTSNALFNSGPGYPTDSNAHSSMPPQPGAFSYTQPDRPTPAPRQPPPPSASSSYVEPAQDTSSVDTSNVDFMQATKLCKFAMSALQYEDVDTAVQNLTKALHLLKPGAR